MFAWFYNAPQTKTLTLDEWHDILTRITRLENAQSVKPSLSKPQPPPQPNNALFKELNTRLMTLRENMGASHGYE